MKKHLLSIVLIICSFVALAQEAKKDTSYWTRGADAGFAISQAGYTKNFVGGPKSNLALTLTLNAKAEYKKDKITWTNQLQFLYGFINNVDDDNGFVKSGDRLFLDTKLGYKIAPKWNVFGSLNVLTQFTSTNATVAPKALISRFLAPGYFTETAGVEYVPNKHFNLQFGLGSLRQTVVYADELKGKARFGVADNANVLTQGGFQLVANYDKNLAPNITFKWRYSMFAPYNDFSNGMVHDLFLAINAKVSKSISASFTGQLRKDPLQSADWQVGQVIGIGITKSW
jgi:hypothetical protein